MELGNFVGSETPLTVTVIGLHSIDNVGSGLFIHADAMLRGKLTIVDAVINGTGGPGGVVGPGASCGLFLSNIMAGAAPRGGGSLHWEVTDMFYNTDVRSILMVL